MSGVVSVLGRGAFGVVELVDRPGGRVARKRLALTGSGEDIGRARQRIRREAEVLRRLDHPGIVPLLGLEHDGDDLLLVMPYLPGGSLADRVAREGPLDPAEVARIGYRLAEALAAAHRAGVVHRDLKPGNVLFDAAGQPALADFGAALSQDATLPVTAETRVVGTAGFLAPEQARGEMATAASDVFALGATLVYALTGLPPYGVAPAALQLARAARGEVPDLPLSLPEDLRARLRWMLQPDPWRRPTAAAAFGAEAPTLEQPVPSPGRRRPRRLVAAMALLVLLAAAVGGALAWRARTPDAGAVTALPPLPQPQPQPCTPSPYQPCGGAPAPFTDGERCVGDHADYDAVAANGCEAAPDPLDGVALEGEMAANLVPQSDVDSYPLPVADRFQLDCGGRLRVTLTAPAGVAQRLEVLSGDRVLETAASADAMPATAELAEPSCGSNDSTTLTVRVSTVSGHSAEPYRLQVKGSF